MHKGHKGRVGWIPERFAVEGKFLEILGEDGVWENGWKVIQVETKEDMKERTRQSPDQMDMTAILVEGARRR